MIKSKQEIIKELNFIYESKYIRLPNSLKISINDESLLIEIPQSRCVENMQTDSVAFEGWALVIKNCIKDVNNVIIKWNDLFDSELNKNEWQHYQRFLYRVKRFRDAYSWVNIHQDNKFSLNALIIDTCDNFVLNAPSKPRSRNFDIKKNLNDYKESQLEEFILSHKEVNEGFCKTFNLKCADNQLPVGVFKDNTVSESTRIFPGGKGAIDIWGIDNENSMCIFELKTDGNNKVGALSEMLLYSYIIQDVIKGKIQLNKNFNRSKEVKGCKSVKCYLLAPKAHPLINSGVFALLNNSGSNIEYRYAKISDSFDFEIL